MTPSGAEYIKRIRENVQEIDPSEVNELLHEGAVIVDVRETEEFNAGHLPGAKHVGRSFLESRIEGTAPDRSQRVILYCASGQRSAFSASWPIEVHVSVCTAIAPSTASMGRRRSTTAPAPSRFSRSSSPAEAP